jgi:hypothetical protein
MPKVHEEKPDSLPEYLALVENYQRNVEQSLWYRGCGRSCYTLLPSLYRHKKAKKPEQFADLERRLMTRFRQRSLPYHSRSLADDWDALFFMQHYGIPTRLLDWSENPLIALHFALMGAPRTVSATGNITFKESAVVWILDPVEWNRHALTHQSFDGGVLTPGDEPLKGYKPAPTFSGMFNHPVALYGSHNSPRIVAQQGVFTIFGQNTVPMEKVYGKESFPTDCLIKITIKSSVIKRMRISLLNHGVTESVVLPDLEGLAREIKRTFDFEG